MAKRSIEDKLIITAMKGKIVVMFRDEKHHKVLTFCQKDVGYGNYANKVKACADKTHKVYSYYEMRGNPYRL